MIISWKIRGPGRILAAWLLCAALNGQAGAEVAAKDRAKWRLATRAAAKRAQEAAAQLPEVQEAERILLVEHLAGAMQTNLAVHAALAASREKSQELARAWRRASAENILPSAAEAMRAYSPAPVTVTDIKNVLGPEWPALIEAQTDAFIEKTFPAVFAEARRRVVALAVLEADQRIRYPAMPELDVKLAALLAGRPPAARLGEAEYSHLQDWLEARSGAAGGPMYEEVVKHIRDAGGRMRMEIRRQYEAQVQTIAAAAAIPADIRRADAIAVKLTAELNRAAARLEPSDGAPRYGVFKIVASLRDAAAADLESRRFQAFLRERTPAMITSNDAANAIRSDYAAHASLSNSLALLQAEYLRALPSRIAEAYAGPVPADTPYFLELCGRDEACHELSDLVRNQLQAILPDVRRGLADRQYAGHFTALDEPIPLNDACLAVILQQRGAPPAGLDAALAMMRQGGYAGLPDPAGLELLDETAHKILSAAAARIADGYWAATEQLSLLAALEKSRMDRLRADVQNNRPVNAIAADWRKQLLSDWRRTVRKTGTPYAGLLDNTERQLEKTVRQLYDSVSRDAESSSAGASAGAAGKPDEGMAAAARAMELRPESTQDKAAGSEPREQSAADTGAGGMQEQALGVFTNKNLKCPDGVLVLADTTDGGCEVALYTAAGRAAGARFHANDANAAADAIFAAMQPELRKIMSSSKSRWDAAGGFYIFRRRPIPEFRLYLVVESGSVRHRTSLLLRRRIEEMLGEWSAAEGFGVRPVSLDWKVGLNFYDAGE